MIKLAKEGSDNLPPVVRWLNLAQVWVETPEKEPICIYIHVCICICICVCSFVSVCDFVYVCICNIWLLNAAEVWEESSHWEAIFISYQQLTQECNWSNMKWMQNKIQSYPNLYITKPRRKCILLKFEWKLFPFNSNWSQIKETQEFNPSQVDRSKPKSECNIRRSSLIQIDILPNLDVYVQVA